MSWQVVQLLLVFVPINIQFGGQHPLDAGCYPVLLVVGRGRIVARLLLVVRGAVGLKGFVEIVNLGLRYAWTRVIPSPAKTAMSWTLIL